MSAPTLLLLVVVIGIPSVYVFWLSLTSSTYGVSGGFVGLENYVTVLTDTYFWRAFLNSFVLVNIIVYGEIVFGLAIALLFAGGVPFQRLMVALMLAPFAISPVIAVVSWKYMLDPSIGLITRSLELVGISNFNYSVDPWQGILSIAVLSIWQHLPFTFVILFAAILSIPRELPDAAQVDGATGFQVFRHIIFPAIVPALLIALLFRYVFAFRIFAEVWLLTGGGPAQLTEVLATYLYRNAFRYRQFDVASATGWLMVIASVIISLPYLQQMYRRMFADA